MYVFVGCFVSVSIFVRQGNPHLPPLIAPHASLLAAQGALEPRHTHTLGMDIFSTAVHPSNGTSVELFCGFYSEDGQILHFFSEDQISDIC